MTAFLITCIFIFVLSLTSNIVFILTSEESRGGAVFGMIAFTAMTAWAIFLLFG